MTRLARIEASFVGSTGALLGAAVLDTSRAGLVAAGLTALVCAVVLGIAGRNEA